MGITTVKQDIPNLSPQENRIPGTHNQITQRKDNYSYNDLVYALLETLIQMKWYVSLIIYIKFSPCTGISDMNGLVQDCGISRMEIL